jgi:hypothetical protein
MLFKNSVRTSKRTPHFTITKINWLTLFKEIIAVYSENHSKPIITKFRVTDHDSWYIYLPLGFEGLDKGMLLTWRMSCGLSNILICEVALIRKVRDIASARKVFRELAHTCRLPSLAIVALNCCPVNMSAAGFQPAVVRDCNLLK